MIPNDASATVGAACARVETATGRFLHADRRCCELLGHTSRELEAIDLWTLVHADDLAAARGDLRLLLAGEVGEIARELRLRHRDGHHVRVRLTVPRHWSPGEAPPSLLAILEDLAACEQVETALRQRGEDLAHLLEFSRTLAITLDLQTMLQAAADGASRLLGMGSAAIYLQDGDWLNLQATTPPLPPEMPDAYRRSALADHPRVREAIVTARPVLLPDAAAADLSPAERDIIEARRLRTLLFLPLAAGEQILGTLIVGSVGAPRPVSAAQVDQARTLANLAALAVVNARLYESVQRHVTDLEREVAERQRAEAALRVSEEKFAKAFHTSPDAVNINRLADGVYVAVNRSFATITGYSEAEVLGRTSFEMEIWNDPEDRRRLVSELQKKGEVTNLEATFRLKDGRVRTGLMSATLIEIDGEPHILSITRDITRRKRAEDALRESEERLRLAIMAANQGLYDLDLRTGKATVSPEYATMLGHDPDTFEESNAAWLERLHPDDHARVAAIHRDYVAGRLPHYQVEFRQRTATGDWKWILSVGKIVERDAGGRPLRMLGTHTDITARKQAEEERVGLQAQLTQAQKMESVGRLAGGVAHDFNNMLGVILGHAELALEQVEPDSALHANLEEIRKAAQRSADLTRQLLAFARKQTIAPRVLDLNATIESMVKMLRRLIGEDVDLAWLPGADLWPVCLDPSQVDQILANLCVNARDAIAGVGKVTLETGNVAFDEDHCAHHAGLMPGEFVLLAVSDNGCGMDAETQAHLFEPFFTTKDVGQGTGLGLATVYGVVRQNQGFVNVYSEPGLGTTFKIYLPRHVAAAAEPPERRPQTAPRGSETILLVEDEPAILELTQRVLERQGYAVLPARTPGEALRLADAHGDRIDLLLSDVIMPEMNGRDLAARLRAAHPAVRHLFMSGYTANVIAKQGVLDPGVHFLQKPFSPNELVDKVRGVLEG